MNFDQVTALAVLVAVVAALVSGKVRSDVAALAGAGALLGVGVVRPVEAQSAFASPALIALASLFVIAYAMELSGLLGAMIRAAIRLCQKIGSVGIWLVIGFCGSFGAFLNNTPMVVMAAPVVRDAARSLGQSPKRYLIPLSYITVLGGCCTLIGTSTNLLVNDMAQAAGQPTFSMFDITPVGLALAAVGGVYVLLVTPRMFKDVAEAEGVSDEQAVRDAARTGDELVGDASVFAQHRPLDLKRGLLAACVFVSVIAAAAIGIAPIAASAFTGAVLLILVGVISAEDAYRGLRPEILLLIAGMVVIGIALEVSGLAALGSRALIGAVEGLSPFWALFLLYGVTLFATEILSNAAVAVLVTPIAVALAESLGVSPRPFMVAVMMSASAAFATPFGYQTNVLVYEMGRYSFADFLKVGVPLNLLTWATAMVVIPMFFPF